MKFFIFFLVCVLVKNGFTQNIRRLGKLQEVFAWTQLTYNINGELLLENRFGEPDELERDKRQAGSVFFNNNDADSERDWNQNSRNDSERRSSVFNREPPPSPFWSNNRPSTPPPNRRPTTSANTFRPFTSDNTVRPARPVTPTTTVRPSDEVGRFFIQYNNVPMGMERVGNRLFVTLPRRRYGIPATVNYIELDQESNNRSPPLKPYPNYRDSRSIISVYRTRADQCGRLWMVDTGLLELPDTPRQLQPPAIVVFDLSTDRQIFRYQFKSSDIPAANTPTGLASITVDITSDCADAYAYVPDLTTFGLIVYSLRSNDSWRLRHNYFSFNPVAGALNIADQRFMWSDGIFSITLTEPNRDGCRTAYFHPLISTQEFSVSTCVLKNRTASNDSNYWAQYSLVGDRGENSQCTMHDYHQGSRVVFFADIGRNALSCWNTGNILTSSNVAILAQDSRRLSYPADLHVTGDEVWVIANALPRFGYSRYDTEDYNFYIYKGNVQNLIQGTACDNNRYVKK